jgi:uncharacterized membrane protein
MLCLWAQMSLISGHVLHVYFVLCLFQFTGDIYLVMHEWMIYVNIYSLIINRGLAQIKFTESKPDKILKSKLFYTIVEQVNLKQLVLGYVHVYSGIHDRQFKNGGIHVHVCLYVFLMNRKSSSQQWRRNYHAEYEILLGIFNLKNKLK